MYTHTIYMLYEVRIKVYIRVIHWAKSLFPIQLSETWLQIHFQNFRYLSPEIMMAE